MKFGYMYVKGFSRKHRINWRHTAISNVERNGIDEGIVVTIKRFIRRMMKFHNLKWVEFTEKIQYGYRRHNTNDRESPVEIFQEVKQHFSFEKSFDTLNENTIYTVRIFELASSLTNRDERLVSKAIPINEPPFRIGDKALLRRDNQRTVEKIKQRFRLGSYTVLSSNHPYLEVENAPGRRYRKPGYVFRLRLYDESTVDEESRFGTLN